MKLTILGSSSALPTSERYPSAHLLNAGERLFLIDCGEGTQMQLRKNHIRFAKINHIFISHLHGDHIFGIYGLLSTFNLMSRKTPLNIYAPENYDLILKSHLSDFDINLDFDIVFTSLSGKDPFLVLDDKNLTVTAFPLKHRVPSFGFLFREKQAQRKIIKECISQYHIPIAKMGSIKLGEDFITEDGNVVENETITIDPPKPLSYAYCSDTRYFKRLPSFVRDVSVLYHEATFDKDDQKLAKITGHSTSVDAANVALQANAGALIIGHFSSRYRSISHLVNEASEIFPVTYAATDNRTYEISELLSF
jgi:ribonuclease Z